jgi:hypothetical protein
MGSSEVYLHLSIAVCCFSTLTVLLRFFVRFHLRASEKHSFGSDDGFILGAWVFLIGLLINGGYSEYRREPLLVQFGQLNFKCTPEVRLVILEWPSPQNER